MLFLLFKKSPAVQATIASSTAATTAAYDHNDYS